MTLIYQDLQAAKALKRKKFAVLIDPDKIKTKNIRQIIDLSISSKIDYFFIGGSLLVNNVLNECIQDIKKYCNIPVILFPGGITQVSLYADAILLLSLISGRNPDLLIGRHVEVAPILAKSQLEVLSTGYMLIDGGVPTSASYMSNTTPIPNNKDEIAVCTALAGELLGLKLIYMDAGSGAKQPISLSMIASVSKHTSVPLIVGGGIRTPEQAYKSAKAGADVIVVGNAIESNPDLLVEIAQAIHSIEQTPVLRG